MLCFGKWATELCVHEPSLDFGKKSQTWEPALRSWRLTQSDPCVHRPICCTFFNGLPIRVSTKHPWILEKNKVGTNPVLVEAHRSDPFVFKPIRNIFSSGRPIRVSAKHPLTLEKYLKVGTKPALVEAHPVRPLYTYANSRYFFKWATD